MLEYKDLNITFTLFGDQLVQIFAENARNVADTIPAS